MSETWSGPVSIGHVCECFTDGTKVDINGDDYGCTLATCIISDVKIKPSYHPGTPPSRPALFGFSSLRLLGNDDSHWIVFCRNLIRKTIYHVCFLELFFLSDHRSP